MSFVYSQSTGVMTYDGDEMGVGYSGNGDGLNNPDMQEVQGIGPIPQGLYAIQDPETHGRLGPVAMELLPSMGTVMFGRSGFFIHGDNAEMDHTASEGCIILGHDIRVQMGELVVNGENILEVVA